MRVALVRGSLLRPWEVPNYLIEGIEVELFVTPGVAPSVASFGLPIHPLRAPSQVAARLGPRARGALDLVVGPTERLLGLEGALRGFDVAHVLELSNPFSLQAVHARERGACRAVVATVMENIAFAPARNRFVAARVRAVAAGVDRFVAITERARLHLQTAGVPDERITVLPLGVDTDRFTPVDTHGAAEREPLRVLCVSRLEPAKGVEDLATAVGLLAKQGVPAELSYVGSGPSEGRIRSIAEAMGITDRVRFEGAVAYDDLHEVHTRHDVLVLASAPSVNWREQFGFAVVEAMASGLAVVVGDSGSLVEVVAGAGVLVRPHDPLDLAEKLKALAADPAERRRLGEAARQRVVDHYSLPVIRSALSEVYASTLEGRRARNA